MLNSVQISQVDSGCSLPLRRKRLSPATSDNLIKNSTSTLIWLREDACLFLLEKVSEPLRTVLTMKLVALEDGASPSGGES
ncbi:hypothetical protein QE152_g5952 [Popillia japonica]|uniref:Uncharacterized protein n=1 Tax=Popillia japonica TaxID=7064 RepID=A0AAW1MLB5_POPJA